MTQGIDLSHCLKVLELTLLYFMKRWRLSKPSEMKTIDVNNFTITLILLTIHYQSEIINNNSFYCKEIQFFDKITANRNKLFKPNIIKSLYLLELAWKIKIDVIIC